MPQPVVCPDLAQYQRLAAGTLAEVDEEALLEHLEHCDSCAQKLSTLAERDTLVELIRKGQVQGDGASAGVLDRLVQRLSKLRPGDASATAGRTGPRESAPLPALTFACLSCGKRLKVKGELVGKKVQCPHCRQAMRVPAAAAGGDERGRPAVPPAVAGTVSPQPGSRLEVSTVGWGKGPSAVTDSRADQSQPAGDKNRQHYDFLAPPQAPDELGRLGPYRVLRVLGAGGMGVVFRAEDPQLARLVALKAMLPALAASDSARQRFLREARAAAAIKHDHIVTIYQVGEDRGVPFLAMDFLEGEPLDARLDRAGKLPLSEVLRIGREMALGLAAAHERGLIHRDIKPANIWLETPGGPGASATGGRVKILDFGLARAVGAEGQLTQQGAIVGTPAYMAPEQAQGKTVDPRSDLFSLGCVLYRIATGEPPFRGTDMISTLMAVATENPRLPHELEPGLPPAVSALIMALLAKEPAERPPSAQAVAEALEGIETPEPARIRPGKPNLKAGRLPRKKWPIAVGLAACLLLGLGGWFLASIVFKTRVKTVEGEAFVVLEIEQADAEVFVDGDRISVTVPGDNKPVEVQVEPGQHKLRISKDGFVAVSRDIELKTGKSDTIRVRLEPVTKVAQKEVPATVPADALRRADIPEAVLASIGGGDPKRAPPELVAVWGDGRPHRARVRCLTFSADGRWLASASEDRTVILWETATGRTRRVLRGHSGQVCSVAFSKDGRTLVAASLDGTLTFWPTEKDAEPETLRPDLGEIFALAASADGRFLAAGGKNGTITLWKWGQWDKPTTLATLPGPLWSLAFSPDGELLASGWGVAWLGNGNWAGDSAIRVYKTADGQLTHTLPGHPEKTLPDGRQLGDVRSLCVSRDGKILASVGTNNKVKVWDLASGKSIAEFEHGFHHGARVTISPDSRTLAATEGPGVAIFDLPSRARQAGTDAVRGFADVWGLAFSPDGKLLAIADELGGVLLYDTTGWKPKKGSSDPGHTREVYSVAFSPDGRWLASGSADTTVRVWDLATGTTRHTLSGHSALVGSVVFSPDGKLLASGSHDGTIGLWDPITGARVRTLKGYPPISSVWFSPDSKLVAAGTADGGVRMWSARNGEEARMLPGLHVGVVRGLAFSADGQRLATGGQDGKIVITDLASGKVLQSFKRNTAVFTVAFGADGETVAAGYAPPEPVVRLWNLKDKDFVSLQGHTDIIHAVLLRSDGRLAVTTSLDGSVRLWEIGGNLPRKMVLGVGLTGEKPWFGALSPDGRYVATSNTNGTIYLFRLPGPAENVGEWLAARGSPPRGLSHEAWLERVKGLYVGNVPDAVSERLGELNPGFDCRVSSVIDDGVVAEMNVRAARDISPLRALPGLRRVSLASGPLADLTPLKDMKLTWLHCEDTLVSDLTPLKDMKLTFLNCYGLKVSDLSPLKDMKLSYLNCFGTKVSDLTPLKDMKLTQLICGGTQVADLSPLKDMKLTVLDCHNTPVSDLSPLKGMPLTELRFGGTPVSDLTPLKDMKLTFLDCSRTKVSDLSPLKDMKLTTLYCFGTQVSDLSPLKDVKLTELWWYETQVTDAGLMSLREMSSLRVLKLFSNPKVTDAGLACLKKLTSLEILDLHNTQLTDAGLVHLKGLLGLRELRLEQSRVSDAGLEHLAGLKNLTQLSLNGTAVTDRGVAKLQAALPRCNIIANVKVPAPQPATTPQLGPPPPASAALEALRRDQIAPEALKIAGDGDPNKAPASLVAVLGDAQPIHAGPVSSVAFSPDGRWLASGSYDKTIMLRDAANGRVKRILQGHSGPVFAVDFSKDSRTLVSASHDGTLRLWSVDRDEKPTIVEAKLGQQEIRAMAVSSDGRFLAAAGDSGLIRLWKWGAWAKPIEFPDLTGKVKIGALAFSPDGELLACGGQEEKEDARVRIYATADGKEKTNLPNKTTRVRGLSFSHDGKHLAAVRLAGGEGRVWEVASGKTVAVLNRATFPGEWPDSFCVAWSPDDKTLAVGEYMKLEVYDFPSGTKRTDRFDFTRGVGQGYESEPIRALAFSPRGDMLAAAGSYEDVPVWDTTHWKLQYLERGHRHSVRSVAVSASGEELLSIGDGAALLRWPLARPREPVVRTLDFRKVAPPLSAALVGPALAYSHDGRTSIITWHSGMAVRNTVTDEETMISAAPVFLQQPAVSPDGRFVAAGGGDGYLHLWDLALGRDVHRFATKGRWCGLAFSRDGKLLGSCNEETKRVTVWDVATGDEGYSWEVKAVSRVSTFSPQGQIVATGHDDGSILLWDTATRQVKRALAGHSAPIRALQFTPDGKTLVSSGNDGVIRLWNPEAVRAREVIPLGPANQPLTFDLDPSGKYLIVVSQGPLIYVLRLPRDGDRASP